MPYGGETATTRDDIARRYVRSIRNPAKRAYADRYWRFLKGTFPGEPDRGSLSYMAAQAVEMQLAAIKRGEGLAR